MDVSLPSNLHHPAQRTRPFLKSPVGMHWVSMHWIPGRGDTTFISNFNYLTAFLLLNNWNCLVSHYLKPFLGELQRIAFRLMLSSSCMCVCVCLCVSVCVCVYAAFVDLRKTVWDRDVLFSILLRMTPDITCKSFTQIGLQIPRWRTKWRPWNAIIGSNSAIY